MFATSPKIRTVPSLWAMPGLPNKPLEPTRAVRPCQLTCIVGRHDHDGTMTDPSSLATGVGLVKSAWALLEYVRATVGAEVIAAYFKYDGTRIAGSEKIEIEYHPTESKPQIWWYSVKSIADYVFVREPVNPSCAHELIGQVAGEPVPDSRFWRWVAPVLPGRIYDGEAPNLKVDFMVFGYRPKALLKHFGER
jgi:hypothetical protein